MQGAAMTESRWWRAPRAWQGGGVVLVGVALVTAAIWGRVDTPSPRPGPSRPTVVWIAAGSEDHRFFADPAVQDEFRKHGYQVYDIPVGSLDMAAPQFCRTKYDLLFPSSSVVADQLAPGIGGKIDAFSTPLVALTWEPLLNSLIDHGLASRSGDGTYSFHLGAYLDATKRKLLWSDIVPASIFSQPSRFQAQFSDPSRSNSGAMVIADASWLLNHHSPVAGPKAIRGVAAQLADALAGMGYMQDTSDPVIDNYLTYYMHGAPLVFTYESEFIDRVVPAEPALLKSGLPQPVMMYLDPALGSEHTLIARTDPGKAVADLLVQPDGPLLTLEEAHGFRVSALPLPGNPSHGVAVQPPGPYAQPPDLPNLEALINAIKPAPAATPTPTASATSTAPATSCPP
jgi:hypothetical protein